MAQNDDLYPPGTTVAVSNRGSAGQWQVGTYRGIDGALHRVSFSAGSQDRYFEAQRICGPGQIFIDSRGVVMKPMTFGEALETVHGLASHKHDADPDKSDLTTVRAWQQTALEAMHDLVVNHHERIDESYRPPVACGAWADEVVGCRSDLDPVSPIEAIRICLELGEMNLPAQRDARIPPAEAEAIERARQACSLVRELIGTHGSGLGSRIAVVSFKQGL